MEQHGGASGAGIGSGGGGIHHRDLHDTAGTIASDQTATLTASLATQCSMEVKVEGGASCLRIPTPLDGSIALLKAASVRAPEVLLHLETRVVTRRTLPSQRKVPAPTIT